LLACGGNQIITMLRTPRTPTSGRFLNDDRAYQPLHQPTNLKRPTPEPWFRRTGWILAMWTAGVVVILWFGYVMIIGGPISATRTTITPTTTTELKDEHQHKDMQAVSKVDVQKSSTIQTMSSTISTTAPTVSSVTVVSPTSSASVILLPGNAHQNDTWTVKLPVDMESLLSAHEYAEICASAHKMAHHIHEAQGFTGHPSYYTLDETFRDVTTNLSLPENTCNLTMTYLVESGNEGAVGPVLMGLWLAYGLAKREGREFFIENGDW